MDWIEFGSNAIKDLAWPAVALYLLRPQKAAITALIGRITRGKIGPAEFEAKVAEQVESIAIKAEQLSAAPVELPKLEPIAGTAAAIQATNMASGQGTVGSAPINPRVETTPDADSGVRTSSVIAGNWAKLEETIRLLAVKHKVEGAYEMPLRPFQEVLNELHEKQVLKWPTVTLALNLYQVRNEVVHSTIEPPRETADSFVATCRKVEKRTLTEEAAWQESFKQLVETWKRQQDIPK